jgi:hypothetical protein
MLSFFFAKEFLFFVFVLEVWHKTEAEVLETMLVLARLMQ